MRTHDDTQFSVLVVKDVWDPQSPEKSATFTRELRIPFAPTIGIRLSERNWESGPLTSVTWVTDEQRFLCRVAVEEPYSDGTDDFTIEFLIEMATDSGWKR